MKLILVAHRGYSGKAPESTMAAFQLALDHGFKDIEFDVQPTSDGVPVIMHDETLERTTNGTGRVDEHTLAELRSLDAGSWFSPKYENEPIPTLHEVLTKLKGRANLHIELKKNNPGLGIKLHELLVSTGWLADALRQTKLEAKRRPRLVISSVDRGLMLESISLLPRNIAHEMIVDEATPESLQWAADHGLRSYHPAAEDVTPDLVRQAQALGVHLGAWWWTPAEQNVTLITGARYAFVDSPSLHRRPAGRRKKPRK